MKYITSYSRDWPERFNQIANILRDYLPESCLIHHVGSTSIPGMPAKDIVDLDIECPPGSMPAIIAALDKAGYEHEGDLGIPSREAFRPYPGSTGANLPPHNLYACERHAPELFKHIAFRDYLIEHPDRAEWLAGQKIEADQIANSRDAYIENKAGAYEIIVAEALAWAKRPLKDKIALVAGATRGAGRGIAVELGAAGATVYVTGRTTRTQRSEYNRPETIEETAELVTQAGGQGIAVQTDHLDKAQVQALVERIEAEYGRLDVLVNDIWGAEYLAEWDVPVWKHSLEDGLRLLRLAIDTHIITSHFALPLLIKNPDGLVVEVTDGTADYNASHYRLSLFYDLAKISVIRLAWAQAQELAPYQCTAVALTPGWLRSEMMLEGFGVTEVNWREATADHPHFAISETPRFVGRAVAHLAGDVDVGRFNGQSLSSGQLAKIYNFTDLDGSQPECWRYILEVQEAGKPADVTGYR